MKNYMFKNLLILVPLLVVVVSCGKDDDNDSSSSLLQVERLARPAINEGLVLSNDNLNAFNSITPSSDLDGGNPAVLAVQSEAITVLKVVKTIGSGAPAVQSAVDAIAGQFLPDVMRISVDNAHIGALVPDISRTANAGQTAVGYTSCLSVAAGAPLLCGGRKIRDDVIDITLSYIAAGAAAATPTTGTTVPVYAIKDNINYNTAHPQPLLGTFPFLAPPL